MRKIYYQPMVLVDSIAPDYEFPKELHSFMAFATREDCELWLALNGYQDDPHRIVEYHDDDIEDATIIDAYGNVIDITAPEVIKKQATEFIANFTMWRGTKKELEKELSDHFRKKITLANTTENDCEESKEYDYRYTFNLIGEDDEYEEYIDIDIYFLKMRKKGHIYITEVSVEYY